LYSWIILLIFHLILQAQENAPGIRKARSLVFVTDHSEMTHLRNWRTTREASVPECPENPDSVQGTLRIISLSIDELRARECPVLPNPDVLIDWAIRALMAPDA